MSRRPRIEFPGAVHHVFSRGNRRPDIADDDADRQRLVDRLERTVGRYGWALFSDVVMTNHLHAFFTARNKTELSLPNPFGSPDIRVVLLRGFVIGSQNPGTEFSRAYAVLA